MRTIDIYLPKNGDDLGWHKFTYDDCDERKAQDAGENKIWAYVYPNEQETGSSFKLVRAHPLCAVPSSNDSDLIRERAEGILRRVLEGESQDVKVHFILHIGGHQQDTNLKISCDLNERASVMARSLGIKSLYFYCWGSHDPIYKRYVLGCEDVRIPLPGTQNHKEFIDSLQAEAPPSEKPEKIKEIRDELIPRGYRSEEIRIVDEIHEIWDPIAGSICIDIAHPPENLEEKGEKLRSKLDELIKVLNQLKELELPNCSQHKNEITEIKKAMSISDSKKCLDWSKRLYLACEMIRADRESVEGR